MEIGYPLVKPDRVVARIFSRVGLGSGLPVVVRKFQERAFKKRIARDIQYLTDVDRNIIGYLLEHNQKTFTHALDGGYASVLISKGYIVCSMRPRQVAPDWEVPFTVPDNVWEVFSEHKESFPCEASKRTVADCPWAIPWEQR
jgi:hypothetical protein